MRVRPGLLIVLALSLALAVYVGSKVAMRPRLRPGERLVFISEMFDRRKTGFAARMTLNAHRFDQLQSMADTLIAGGYTMPSGVPQIHVFHSEGFGTVDDENNAEQWQLHLDRLREWNDARPNSVLARIALAEGLIGRGWAARGEGWGSSVTQDRWRRFHDDIDEAGQILRQCPPEAASNPEWWEDDLQVLHAMGADSLYRVMSDSARRAFPDQWHLYNEMAMHLMPRWYGRTGDWESFAEPKCTHESSPTRRSRCRTSSTMAAVSPGSARRAGWRRGSGTSRSRTARAAHGRCSPGRPDNATRPVGRSLRSATPSTSTCGSTPNDSHGPGAGRTGTTRRRRAPLAGSQRGPRFSSAASCSDVSTPEDGTRLSYTWMRTPWSSARSCSSRSACSFGVGAHAVNSSSVSRRKP